MKRLHSLLGCTAAIMTASCTTPEPPPMKPNSARLLYKRGHVQVSTELHPAYSIGSGIAAGWQTSGKPLDFPAGTHRMRFSQWMTPVLTAQNPADAVIGMKAGETYEVTVQSSVKIKSQSITYGIVQRSNGRVVWSSTSTHNGIFGARPVAPLSLNSDASAKWQLIQ